MFPAVSTASHMIGAWRKHELFFQAAWPLASFVALEDFVLIAVIENNDVMSSLQTKRAIFMAKKKSISIL